MDVKERTRVGVRGRVDRDVGEERREVCGGDR